MHKIWKGTFKVKTHLRFCRNIQKIDVGHDSFYLEPSDICFQVNVDEYCVRLPTVFLKLFLWEFNSFIKLTMNLNFLQA